MELGSVLVFALFFLLSYYFMRRQKNLPPGPFSLPFVGCVQILWQVRQRRSHLVLNELSQKYGPVFSLKFGKQLIVVLHGFDTIHEVLVKRSDEFSDRPTDIINQHLTRNGAGIILNNYNHNWKVLRRFTLQALRDFGVGKTTIEEKIAVEIEATSKRFIDHGDDPVDINACMQMIIRNIIYGIVFGVRYEFGDTEFNTTYLLTSSAFRGDGDFDPVGILPAPVIRLIKFVSRQQTLEERMTIFSQIADFIEEKIAEHEATFDENTIRDLIDLHIKTTRDLEDTENTDFTKGNLQRVITDLFLAGSETTSVSLDWAFLYMAENPDIQFKCQIEIEKVLGDKFIQYADRDKLPYLNATLMEIQRLSIIVPLSVTHCTRVDTELHGFNIPANTSIIPNLYSACMDTKYWDQPDQFEPERFLDEKGKLIKTEALIPFSTGPRQCLGEPLAKMELFLVFANMLQRFSFHHENPEKKHSMKCRDFQVTNCPEPYRLRVQSRN